MPIINMAADILNRPQGNLYDFIKKSPRRKIPKGVRVKNAPEVILCGTTSMRGIIPAKAKASEPKASDNTPIFCSDLCKGKLLLRPNAKTILNRPDKMRLQLKKTVAEPYTPSILSSSSVH